MHYLLSFLKRILKRKLFWIGLIVIILIGVWYWQQAQKPDVEYTTETVYKGDLKQTVSATGVVEAVEQVDLNFELVGELKEVFVEVGDEVAKGDDIAKLDSNNLEIQVRQAQANVDSARAQLNKLIAGASSEDINVSKENVESARIAYENAQKDYDALVLKIDSDIKNYEDALAIAQTNLTDTTNTAQQAVEDARDSVLTIMDSNLISATHSLDVVKVIHDEDDFKNLFSVEQFQYKVDSKNYYDMAVVQVANAKTAVTSAQTSLSDTDISSAITQTLAALNTVKIDLDRTFLGLTYSRTDIDFTQAELDAFKSNVKAEQSIINSAVTSTESADQTYENAKLSYTSSVNTAQGSVDTAQNNLDVSKASKDVQIAAAQAKVDSALSAYNISKAQLDQTQAPARSSDISYQRALVNQAQAALDLIKSQLDDYTLVAYSDGVVTEVNYEAGEQTSLTMPVATILGDMEYQIKVDIPESDITKIKLGNSVDITLDAYSDDIVFTGEVVLIYPAETLIQDVVYYRLIVEMDDADYEIKSGMTANCDVLTAMKEQVLITKFRAVKEQNDQKFVRILVNEIPEEKQVVTGLRGDDGLVEVVSGLQEGDEVIVFEKELK